MSLVKPITGGVTGKVGMTLADLGIPRWDAQRGCNAVCFGDNFSTGWGIDWQSPSIVCYDDDYDCLGIPTASGIASEGHRRQTLPYQHNENGVSTMLPTDFIRLDGVWHMAVMVVGMGGLGDELRTEFWRSYNLVDWENTGITIEHPSEPPRVMLTFDRIGDTIFIFSTAGLKRDRDIWLWSCPADRFPAGDWQSYGLVLPGRYGELCFRAIQGNSVLSFFDVNEYRQTALTVVNPTDDWREANTCHYAFGDSFPQLYGGYITPASTLNEPDGMEFLVSQWNTQSNDPYRVCLFYDSLQAKGPLLLPEPKPIPVPEPEPEPPPKPAGEDDVTTPQQLYETLLRELSASGSVNITTPEGDTLTLREAVIQIFEKERGWHFLRTRPRHPADSDDQLGHVLNGRAEGLFTQACVVAVADKMGIDTRQLYDQVKGSLG